MLFDRVLFTWPSCLGFSHFLSFWNMTPWWSNALTQKIYCINININLIKLIPSFPKQARVPNHEDELWVSDERKSPKWRMIEEERKRRRGGRPMEVVQLSSWTARPLTFPRPFSLTLGSDSLQLLRNRTSYYTCVCAFVWTHALHVVMQRKRIH